ncbi:hypothetical protein GOY07_01955 [Wolbachia endosymbiont of Litomosoides sigmodontis]|uniref:hypothetical protein n=1 Tax=Wolbachia endosymbiont of Litomosoides sigmodontis TaxID=80850 RepID=UPI00158EBF2A|nr:hypothetical protein [Wolbachia endosymbiont of Litomosoides sigmodontis]QKX02964.1 hypothetical protein GOY07_01955 [Wolbachia endosymbiont of Litomosoides sigmodontis]
MLCTRNITINFPNIVKYDDMPPKEKQVMKMFGAYKESGNLRKFFVKIFSKTKKMWNLFSVLMK